MAAYTVERGRRTGRSAPAIVLLGARLGPGGAPGPALRRRIAHAHALHAAGAAPVVIATGGPAGTTPTEARVMRDALLSAGLPAAAVLEEPCARDTVENARFATALMRARGLTEAIVVSDRYHLPRALLAFRLLGMPATGSGPPWGTPADPARRLAALLREAAAIPVDLARGIAWRLRRG